MSSNQELMAQAGVALGAIGVRKSDVVMTTANMATGDFMDRTQVERLVDLTVSQSGWLSAVSLKTRKQRSGEMPRMVINDVVTEGVPENAGKTVATVAETDNVPYNCRKYQATWFLTVEDMREAMASGEPDFERKVRAAFAKAMGNDMARWCLRGDTLLDTSTRLNRLLRQRDGWLKQARAKALSFTTTRGAPFNTGLFTAMHSKMPEEFRDDANLRWFMPSIIDIAWTDSLREPTNSVGSQLQDRATIERTRFDPHGIPQLIVPQMPTNGGFNIVTASTAVADAVVDNTGSITFTVDTLFGGFNAKWVSRCVKVTLNSTGASENAIVFDDSGALKITTVGTLGQNVVSTTASEYTLDLCDVTTALLTNPANLFIALCDEIRAYRKFEQEGERWRIDVFYEADAGIFNENALVIQDGIVAPSFDFGADF